MFHGYTVFQSMFQTFDSVCDTVFHYNQNVIFEKLTQGNALHILHSILISTVKVNFMLWRFLQISIECSIMLCLALDFFFWFQILTIVYTLSGCDTVFC